MWVNFEDGHFSKSTVDSQEQNKISVPKVLIYLKYESKDLVKTATTTICDMEALNTTCEFSNE